MAAAERRIALTSWPSSSSVSSSWCFRVKSWSWDRKYPRVNRTDRHPAHLHRGGRRYASAVRPFHLAGPCQPANSWWIEMPPSWPTQTTMLILSWLQESNGSSDCGWNRIGTTGLNSTGHVSKDGPFAPGNPSLGRTKVSSTPPTWTTAVRTTQRCVSLVWPEPRSLKKHGANLDGPRPPTERSIGVKCRLKSKPSGSTGTCATAPSSSSVPSRSFPSDLLSSYPFLRVSIPRYRTTIYRDRRALERNSTLPTATGRNPRRVTYCPSHTLRPGLRSDTNWPSV